MEEYTLEISASQTVTKTVDSKGLREVAKRAQGSISVVKDNREVFCGTGQQLLTAIEVAESVGREL